MGQTIHFEGEYCMLTCGVDNYSVEYLPSHETVTCYDHQWVSPTYQAISPRCTAKPCQVQNAAISNGVVSCSSSPLGRYLEMPGYITCLVRCKG